MQISPAQPKKISEFWVHRLDEQFFEPPGQVSGGFQSTGNDYGVQPWGKTKLKSTKSPSLRGSPQPTFLKSGSSISDWPKSWQGGEDDTPAGPRIQSSECGVAFRSHTFSCYVVIHL